MRQINFTPFMVLANSEKSKRGVTLHRAIKEALSKELVDARIACYEYRFKAGRQGFSQKQFYAPFMIQFSDGERWVIYSTERLRDRIKMVHWDAFNLKAIDIHITRAYVVYPTNVEEAVRKAWDSKHRNYQNHVEYSALDGLIDRNRLVALIHEKSDQVYAELYEHQKLQNGEKIADGRFYDFVGRAFEREVAEILGNEDFLAAWKSGRIVEQRRFNYFGAMMKAFGVDPRQVVSVRATANHKDIGDLPSGGAPKTDIIAELKLANHSRVLKTISCKRSNGRDVSVHQYPASEFARILDSQNEQLKLHLEYFQVAGNFKNMPEGATANLARLINPYLEKLCYWVVGGQGGDGEDFQMADYLVAYRPADNAFVVHTVPDYVNWLLHKCNRKESGTPFRGVN